MNRVRVGCAGESGLYEQSERPGFRPLEVVGEVSSGVRAQGQSSGCSCVPPRLCQTLGQEGTFWRRCSPGREPLPDSSLWCPEEGGGQWALPGRP